MFQQFSSLKGVCLFDPVKINFIHATCVQGLNTSVVNWP